MSVLTDKLKQQAERPPQIPNSQSPIRENLQPKSGHSSQAERAPKVFRAPPREREYLYSTPQSPTFSIHMSDGTTLKADKGVIRATQAQHDEIQSLITKHKRFDISQNMVLVDLSEAEKTAQEHMLAEKARPNAARGMTSTSHSAAKMQTLEGHEIPDALADLKVVELDATHGEDQKIDPASGQNADTVRRE